MKEFNLNWYRSVYGIFYMLSDIIVNWLLRLNGTGMSVLFGSSIGGSSFSLLPLATSI